MTFYRAHVSVIFMSICRPGKIDLKILFEVCSCVAVENSCRMETQLANGADRVREGKWDEEKGGGVEWKKKKKWKGGLGG